MSDHYINGPDYLDQIARLYKESFRSTDPVDWTTREMATLIRAFGCKNIAGLSRLCHYTELIGMLQTDEATAQAVERCEDLETMRKILIDKQYITKEDM